MAPRFINFPDWLKNRDSSPDSALRIYKPAPTTWLSWEEGNRIIEEQAKKNFTSMVFDNIDLEDLRTLHGTYMKGLLDSAGRFRSRDEYGLAVTRDESLTKKQAQGAQSVEYTAILKPRNKIVNFYPVKCLEDQDEEFQKDYEINKSKGFYIEKWKIINNNDFYTTEYGQKKQCGFFIYAPPEEVGPQMENG